MRKLTILVLIISAIVLVLFGCDKVPNVEGLELTINFNPNGGSEVAAITIDRSTKAVTMPDTTKEGYVFDGWYFDNDTFLQPVTSATVLAKLTPETTSITVYAKWIEEDVALVFDDVILALKNSMSAMYLETGGKNVKEDLDTTEAARLIVLEDEFDLDGELEDNYRHVRDLVLQYDSLIMANEIISIIDDVEGDYGDLTSQQLDRLNEISEYLFKDCFVYDDDSLFSLYMCTLDSIDDEEDNVLSQADYTLAKEYMELAQRRLDYLDYEANKDKFNQKMSGFLDLFVQDDIALVKFQNLANYILDYDYDAIMEEDDGDYYPNPSLLVNFLLGALDASEFTADDLGLFLYKATDFAIDSSIADMTESNAEINAIILGYEGEIDALQLLIDNVDSEYLYMLEGWEKDIQNLEENIDRREEDIERNNQTIVSLTAIKPEINAAMVKEVADVFIGIVRIVQSNNILSLIYDMSDYDEMPTIAEIATVIGSFSDAFIDISESYSSTVWTGLITVMEDVIETLDETGMADTLIPTLLSINPFDMAGKVGDLLAVFDSNTLNTFFNEVTADGKRVIMPDMSDPNLLFTNLMILEARIITALVGSTYDAVAFEAAYDQMIEELGLLPTMMPFDIPIEEMEEVSEMMFIAPILVDMVGDLLKDKIVISASRYNDLVTLADLDYLTDLLTEDIPPELYYAPVIMNAYFYIEAVADSVNSFLTIIDDEGEYKEISYSVAGAMFALSIEKVKLDNYILLFDGFDFDVPNYLAAYMINSLFSPDVLTEEEAVELIVYFARNGAEVLGEIASLFGIPTPLLDLIDELADAEEPLLEDLVELLVSLSVLASNAMVNSIDPIDGELLGMEELAAELKGVLEQIKLIYISPVDQNSVIAVLDAVVTLIDIMIIPVASTTISNNTMGKAENDVDYFIEVYLQLQVDYFDSIEDITLDMLKDLTGLELIAGTEPIDNEIVVDITDGMLNVIYSTRSGHVAEYDYDLGWDYYVIETDDPDYITLMYAALDFAVAYASANDFEGTIDIMIDILDEMFLAGNDAFDFDGVPSDDFLIYFAKALTILFGDDINDYLDVIAEAGNDNLLSDALSDIQDSYSLIKLVATNNYGDVLATQDRADILALMEMLA